MAGMAGYLEHLKRRSNMGIARRLSASLEYEKLLKDGAFFGLVKTNFNHDDPSTVVYAGELEHCLRNFCSCTKLDMPTSQEDICDMAADVAHDVYGQDYLILPIRAAVSFVANDGGVVQPTTVERGYVDQGYELPEDTTWAEVHVFRDTLDIGDIYVPIVSGAGVTAWAVPYKDGRPMEHGEETPFITKVRID